MGVWDKEHEDNFYQGDHNTAYINSPKLNPWHSLPGAWEQHGPVNQPKHLQKGDFLPSNLAGASETGTYLVFLTIDTEEHATRFIKDLFKHGLIADVQMIEGGFDRSYLKLGRLATET